MCGQSGYSPGPGVDTPVTKDAAHALRAYTPKTAACNAAFELMVSSLPLAIIHHSLRVFLFAEFVSEKNKYENVDKELLFIASVCHDLGASGLYDGPDRFEIEGADGAVQLMRTHGKSEAEIHEVWTAIAVHTSPGIAERITVLSRLVRLGVLIDFDPITREKQGAVSYGDKIEVALSRLSIEKVLGDAVVEQAVRNPEKAPKSSWPGDLFKSHLEDPDWSGVNRGF